MSPSDKLRGQLRVNERQRGIVIAIDGTSVGVSIGGAVQVFQASGLLVGDEVIVSNGGIARVPGDASVVEV